MNNIKVLILLFMAALLAACGNGLREEYESLKTEAAAETAEDAKRQADEAAAFVKKLGELKEDEEELPEGLLSDAKLLQAQRSIRFAGLTAREKAVQFWESAKTALSASGVTLAQAGEQDPAIKEFVTVREEPNDDWNSYR